MVHSKLEILVVGQFSILIEIDDFNWPVIKGFDAFY